MRWGDSEIRVDHEGTDPKLPHTLYADYAVLVGKSEELSRRISSFGDVCSREIKEKTRKSKVFLPEKHVISWYQHFKWERTGCCK